MFNGLLKLLGLGNRTVPALPNPVSRLNMTTPDQQLNNPTPYPNLLKGLVFGNNASPTNRGVPLSRAQTLAKPNMTPPLPGWTYGNVGNGDYGWRDQTGAPSIKVGPNFSAQPQFMNPQSQSLQTLLGIRSI